MKTRGANRIAYIAITAIALYAVRRFTPRQKSSSDHAFGKSVWMFNHYARTPDMAGGNRHYQLADLLKRHSWNPTIFATPVVETSENAERPVSVIRPVLEQNEAGVDFVWLYSLPYNSNGLSRYANLLSFMVAALGSGIRRTKPDIVVGSSPDLLTAMAASLVARRHSVPFVLEVRDLWPESLIQLGLNSPLVLKPLWGIQRHLYSEAKAIVCLTDGIVAGVLARGVAASKLSMIPNASPAPEPLDPATREATRERLCWSDRVVVIWIGAHGPANNLEVMIEAAQLLKDQPEFLFTFVGNGPAKPALIEVAKDLSNVQFLDPVPKADVQDLLRAADVGVIVHRNTEAVRGARPNKLFDYMAAALPIVLNLDGEARSLVEESNSGLFATPESPEALADKLRELIASPELRLELGMNGFAYVAREHRREDTATQLGEVLCRILSESNHGHSIPGATR